MRVLAACLLGFLGFGALATMAACSDTTDAGSAGAGGASTAGAGGKASAAGSTSTAGTGGGAAECSFKSVDCSACLGEKCATQVNACDADDKCGDALFDLPDCVCDTSKDPDTCIGTFVSENGSLAEKLANCYTLNCEDVCQ